MNEIEKIKSCFFSFIEGSLVAHDIDSVLDLFAEDVMGIGMGEQGVVRCREDLRPMLLNTHGDIDDSKTTITYDSLQVRHYGNDYACISAIVNIDMELKGTKQTSRIGQCASMRRIDGDWKFYMIMATPLSMNIQELDAYPLSFAEDEIESLRMKDQFSRLMQNHILASYKIDLDNGIFESFESHSPYCFPVKAGQDYESSIFESANQLLPNEYRLKFMQTFTLSNIHKHYLSGQTEISLDYEATWTDGKRLWMRSSLHLFRDINGILKGYLYLVDIDDQRRKEIHLTQQAELDLMTNIYNKATVRQKITLALELYSTPRCGAFFMLDLDMFKQINDTYGHGKGDYVIQQTADILKSVFPANVIIGRLGGDEFCVYYPDRNDTSSLEQYASQVCSRISAILPKSSSGPGTSASIGITKCSAEDTFDTLYERADTALYLRKNRDGRNGYTFSQ